MEKRQKLEGILLSAVKNINREKLNSASGNAVDIEINMEVNPVKDLKFNLNELAILRNSLLEKGIIIPYSGYECLQAKLSDIADYIISNDLF